MIRKKLLLTSILLWPIALGGQGRGVDPADLLKPLADSWPSYSGDYTGKRYSALTQVNCMPLLIGVQLAPSLVER